MTHFIKEIERQVRFAEIKHGKFTGSLDHRSMILIEEMGEFIQSVNNLKEKGSGYIHMELELAQIGAVCIRFGESIQKDVIEEKDKQVQLF